MSSERTKIQWLLQGIRVVLLIPTFLLVVNSGIDSMWAGLLMAVVGTALFIWPFGERRRPEPRDPDAPPRYGEEGAAPKK